MFGGNWVDSTLGYVSDLKTYTNKKNNGNNNDITEIKQFHELVSRGCN